MLSYIKNFLSNTIIITSSFCYKLGSKILSIFGYQYPRSVGVIDDEVQHMRAELSAFRTENRALGELNDLLDEQKNAAEADRDFTRQVLAAAQHDFEERFEALRQERRELAASYAAVTDANDRLVAQVERQQHSIGSLTLQLEASEAVNTEINRRQYNQNQAVMALEQQFRLQIRALEMTLLESRQETRRAVEAEAAALALVQRKEAQFEAAHVRATNLAQQNADLERQGRTLRAQLSRRNRQSQYSTTTNTFVNSSPNGSLVLPLYPWGRTLNSMMYFDGMRASAGRVKSYFRSAQEAEALRAGRSCPSALNFDGETQVAPSSSAVMSRLSQLFKMNAGVSLVGYTPNQIALYTVPACMFAVSYCNHDGQLSRHILEAVPSLIGAFFKGLGGLPVQFSRYGFNFEIGSLTLSHSGKELPELVLFSVTSGAARAITAANKR